LRGPWGERGFDAITFAFFAAGAFGGTFSDESAVDLLNSRSAGVSIEISRLGRQANMNLVMGILTAVFGIGLLAYYGTGFTSRIGKMNINALSIPAVFGTELLSFLPRLSTVLLIELFAFFFLRLYRGSLAEIKYFQNEATNLACWCAALKALEDKNQNFSESFIAKFLVTDVHFGAE
jgi:hypothetical protein